MPVRLADQKPIVTLEDFLSTYEDRDHHEAVRAVEFLESKGLLPLKYSSPLFPELNILTSLALWSGSLLLDSGDKPRVILHLNEPVRVSIEDALKALEVDLGTSDYPSLGNHGAAYNRLISQVRGMPLSQGNQNQPDRKAGKELTLPDYINFLAENYSQLHGTDRDIARKVLADYVNILLQTRLRYRSALYFEVQLIECPSEAAADKLVQEVFRLINAIYPKIGLSPPEPRDIWPKKGKKHTRYQPVIKLNKQNIINATQYYHIFQLELNRHFQHYGKRITSRDK